MEIKILQVFYGKDGLPYKDKDRQVHFPITGTGFLGASNTTKIKFYYDELDNLDETTWVAVSKLPNGKVGSRVLESHLDSELNEHYALLELDNYYTQYKGDVFISLQGYQGGVDFDYDEENSQYEIHGTPTIAATGSIKFTINYANQFVGSGETDNINFQRILAALGTKLGMRAYSEHVEELPSEGSPDVFYVVNDDPNNPNIANIYVWNGNTRHYIWVGDNTLDLGEYYTKEQGNQFESGIDNRVTSVEDEIESISSGAPSGTYATVSDLTTADPDHSKVYLVLADGKWYYYNTSTSSWTAGGTYLSTGNAVPDTRKVADINLEDDIGRQELVNNIADDVLISGSSHALMNKAVSSLFDIVYSENLFDIAHATNNYYINPSTGALSSNNTYITTDYILVSEGQKIKNQTGVKIFSQMSFICAYDEFKQLLPSSGASYTNEYTVPSGVRYIRISIDNTNYQNKMIIVGTTVKDFSTYVAPKYILKDSSLVEKIPTIANCFELYKSSNLFDKNNYTANAYKGEDNSYASNSGYFYTNLIEVSAGQTITAWNGGTQRPIKFVCAYDENHTLMQSAGSGSQVNSYTVPSGVKYVYLTFDSSYDVNTLMVVLGTSALVYENYFTPYYVLKASALTKENVEDLFATLDVNFNQLTFADWLNYFNKETANIGYYVYNGELRANATYFTTDFIPVKPNTTYSFSGSFSNLKVRFLDEYNEGKTFISPTKENVTTFTTGANTRYIRYSSDIGNLNVSCMSKTSSPLVGLPHLKLISEDYIAAKLPVEPFLPKEICCAIGTTIEIYNDQVLPCASKYHFQWDCQVGSALNRKFTVTGSNGIAGTYTLKLAIYDDKERMLWLGSSTLKIVSALESQKTICPIGDSLTNGKYWLKYVNETLSSGNIYYVGTRGSVNGQKHEGRSGWSTEKLLTDTDYSYEQPTTPNPFWDDTLERFSWDYYKTTYNINPDCVQIWLGTNDLLRMTKEQFVANMKQIIEYIRDDDATIPIFICLTILPAEQNGIGIQQSNDGFAANKGYWQYNWWNLIIRGVKLLETELLALSDSNLHIIPLVCSHDSKYNFGVVETNVNPHITTVKEPMPVEGVHPQQPGYEQIGDILWGVYCSKLGS